MTGDEDRRPEYWRSRNSSDPTSGRALSLQDDERALSNVVGFVLAFAVIISAVGIVSTFGFDALEDARESELAKNTERSYVLLGQNFNELVEGEAVKRTSEMELRSGSMGVTNETVFTLEIEQSPGSNFERKFAPHSLDYRIDDTVIAYENGATFRGKTGTNASVLDIEPSFICGDDYAVVSLVTLDQRDNRTISGGVARVSGKRTDSQLLYPTNRTESKWGGSAANGSQLTVTVDSPHSGGWQQYFTRDENEWYQPDPDKNEYVCDGPDNGGSVYIKRTVIEVGLDQ